jgi:hypothetical protein
MAQWQRDWGALSSSSTAKRAMKALDPNREVNMGKKSKGTLEHDTIAVLLMLHDTYHDTVSSKMSNG